MTLLLKRQRGLGGARVPRVLSTLILASMVQSSIEEIGEVLLHHPSGLLARESLLIYRGCAKGSAISANTTMAFCSNAELSAIPMRSNGRRVRERLSDVPLLPDPALCEVGGITKGQSSMVVDASLGAVEAEGPPGVPFGSTGATKPSSDGWGRIHGNDGDESVSWEWNLKNMLNEQNGELHPSDPAEAKPSIVGWRKRGSISSVRWADEQRLLLRMGTLKKSRVERLDAVNFCWHKSELPWAERHVDLCLFRLRHGTSEVPSLYNSTDSLPGLGLWLASQRSQHRKGKLQPPRQQALEGLGVAWECRGDSLWLVNFELVLLFRLRYGHSNAGGELGTWLDMQRAAYLRGGLTLRRKAWLTSAGLDFALVRRARPSGAPSFVRVRGAVDKIWEERKRDLLMFKLHCGHCLVPPVWGNSSGLSSWTNTQRLAVRLGRIDSVKQASLEAIGLQFEFTQSRWVARFMELLAFKRDNEAWKGHLGLKGLGSKSNRLAQWARRQVRAAARGNLSPPRARLLGTLGIVRLGAGTRTKHCNDEAEWRARFKELTRYQLECNDKQAGFGWVISPELGQWVHRQRMLHRNGELQPRREHMLLEAGFVFKRERQTWEARMLELEAFKAKYGHTNVPQDFLGNPQLANWVHNMRETKKQGRLSSERVARMDAVGFEWNLSSMVEGGWGQRLRELCAFMQAHGHSVVPQNYPQNPALGRWVALQRMSCRRGCKNERRMAVLLGLGLGSHGTWAKGGRAKPKNMQSGGACVEEPRKDCSETPSAITRKMENSTQMAKVRVKKEVGVVLNIRALNRTKARGGLAKKTVGEDCPAVGY